MPYVIVQICLSRWAVLSASHLEMTSSKAVKKGLYLKWKRSSENVWIVFNFLFHGLNLINFLFQNSKIFDLLRGNHLILFPKLVSFLLKYSSDLINDALLLTIKIPNLIINLLECLLTVVERYDILLEFWDLFHKIFLSILNCSFNWHDIARMVLWGLIHMFYFTLFAKCHVIASHRFAYVFDLFRLVLFASHKVSLWRSIHLRYIYFINLLINN